MSYIIVGLGNPGKEYESTRHNTGRMVLDALRRAYGDGDFVSDSKLKAEVAYGVVGKEKLVFIAPETFMNKSGEAVARVVKSRKAAERCVVIYDDFNLPLGRVKISYNRSSGGHNGLESVIKAVQTEAFPRIRIGIARVTASGKPKVLHGDREIEKFILGKFSPAEMKSLARVSKRVVEALEMIVTEGREKAMSVFNAS